MKTVTDKNRIDEIFNRGIVVAVLPSREALFKRLFEGGRLRIYIGADPTSNSLHLSHAKNYMFLEELRQLGHEVIILVGDFTARIGDPSGRSDVRSQISEAEVKKNVKDWLKQIRPVLNFKDKKNPPKIMHNSRWLSKMSFKDVVGLASNFTVQQMLERDMFQRRFYGEWKCQNCSYRNPFNSDVTDPNITHLTCSGCKTKFPKNEIISLSQGKNNPIFLHEFLYPLMQGYDSVAMDVDVELCGTDQIFNALAGRTLLKRLKNKEKFIIALNLMANPKTGELMSKSRGTGVFLSSPPNEMFGAVMAQPDEMIEVFFVNNTRIPLGDIRAIMASGPRTAKARVAFEIVKCFYGEEKAKEAKEEFDKTFREGGLPDNIQELRLGRSDSLAEKLIARGVVSSKTEWRRLVQEGAVRDEKGARIADQNYLPAKTAILKIGKRRFVKIVVS